MPKPLADQLTQAGAQVAIAEITPAALAALAGGGAANIRDYGRAQGVAFVVWGSATWVGERFSIDGRLMDTLTGHSEARYSDGARAEALAASVRSLARSLTPLIFKQEKIAAIRIQGNQRIESDAIERVIRTAPGDMYDAKQLTADLKAVFAMGYFDDIRIETADEAGGKAVVFVVKEKPTLRVIRIKGNQVFDDEKITAAMTLRTGSILNETRIRSNVERIETLYKDKNYHNVKVAYTIHPLDNNQADLEFVVTEGDKIRIQRIIFQGNQAVSDKQLKKLMKTSEEWIFSWLTSDGELNPEVLDQDIGQIKAHYNNHGYIQARVSEPLVEFESDGIQITVKIDEGPQFKVGKVTVSGDLVQPAEALAAKLNIGKETSFSREVVRNDVLMLTDLYADEGYAYAEIVPKTDTQAETQTVDIDFAIRQGPMVYFEKIIISGNTKTRDKVIRRSWKSTSRSCTRGPSSKKGCATFFRLDYFEDVKVDTAKGSAEDKMVLKWTSPKSPPGPLPSAAVTAASRMCS